MGTERPKLKAPSKETERNKQLIRTFVEAINARDWQKLSTIVAHDFVRHSYAAGDPAVRSREALTAFLKAEFGTFPDGTETVKDLVAEEDKIAARHHFTGTQRGQMGSYPPSGRVLSAEYLAIYRVKDGVIFEAWVEWDNLSGLRQLGHYGG